MKRRLRVLVLLAALVPALLPGASLAFTIGVLPIHSSRVLVERFDPLRVYMERVLRRPVRIESAPDFARFHARTMNQDFDLTITAAHFARIAQKEKNLQPLAQFQPDHDSLLVYNKDAPLDTPLALKGKQLAVIDRLAITVMAAIEYLSEQGLESDRDYKVVEHRTHASVAHSLVSGLAAAAVTTSQGLLQMPDEFRGKLVVHKHIADIPAFVFLVKPDLPREQVERIRAALLAFPQTAEGSDFLRHTGYTAIRPVTEAAMKRADPYLKETRKVLQP